MRSKGTEYLFTGMQIQKILSNGSAQNIELSDPSIRYEYDFSNVGTTTVTIRYGGFTAVLDCEVTPKAHASHTPGDINDDGKVNNKDLSLLFQYLSDWDVTVNEEALDINGDGKVNNKDLSLLFQYLSDWDVTIH